MSVEVVHSRTENYNNISHVILGVKEQLLIYHCISDNQAEEDNYPFYHTKVLKVALFYEWSFGGSKQDLDPNSLTQGRCIWPQTGYHSGASVKDLQENSRQGDLKSKRKGNDQKVIQQSSISHPHYRTGKKLKDRKTHQTPRVLVGA